MRVYWTTLLPLLTVTCVAVLLILVLGVLKFLPQNSVSAAQTNNQFVSAQIRQDNPVRLLIPAINVDAGVEFVGVTPTGEMEVPGNITNVGWFDLGPRPGEIGSAVIAGHLDGANGEAGVFANLHKLKVGDKLYVTDDQGRAKIFIVHGSKIYDPGYAKDVFSSSDTSHLNLVTCDGAWEGSKKSYSKRLVVFADLVDFR